MPITYLQDGNDVVVKNFKDTILSTYFPALQAWNVRYLQGELLEYFVLTNQIPPTEDRRNANVMFSTLGTSYEDLNDMYYHILIPMTQEVN
jgi:hypothetical protein